MKMNGKFGIWITALLGGLLISYAQQQPFSFVLLSDTQFGMYTGDKGFAQETANFEFCVAAVNRLKPAFVVILGDLVNKAGDPAQIKEYKRIARLINPAIPVYEAAGNHDVGNEPTEESLALYRKTFGRDYYSFRAGPVYGIVLDSVLMHTPKNVPGACQEQQIWLQKELEKAKGSGLQHIVLFQHHPVFLQDPEEPDRYENIPRAQRQVLLKLLLQYGVHHVFAGHTHKNIAAQAGSIEIVATGPVGKPLGKDGSGIRVAAVTDSGMEHRYYEFGMMPERLAPLHK
jgi:3',5'-cyclic AMP phosphodiesterase CpdA